MNITIFEYLTVLLGTLQFCDLIHWPWWVILLPFMIGLVLRIAVHIWWNSKSPQEQYRATIKEWRGF